jgi:plastocyanin
MKRRQFFQAAGVGSAALAALSTSRSAEGAARTAAQHAHAAISGPNATATVSFGAWVPGSRFPNLGAAPMLPNNAHVMIPNEVQIKAGGTVNFIIAGFHQIAVYGNGTRPEDIDTSLTVGVTTPPGAPLINDANNRVYRGIDPSVFPSLTGPPQGPGQPRLHDRVEVVHFPERGRYLVICAVLPHFEEEMWGWVKVN